MDHPAPILNACPSCQCLIDVTELEPYAKVVCQNCQDTIRVRTSFHHFQILEQIGTGGMSRVFRAMDTGLNREVALKILNRHCSSDEKRVTQFENEARITASLSHPNIVRVYSAGRDQGYFYIAMELVRGRSLEERIRGNQRITEREMIDLAISTAKGLRAAHEKKMIHRDIKPGNILFAADGTPKIVDFGLALILRDQQEADKEIWATPYYVPPETLNHQPEDHRSDIYSLGATLFHAVLGRPPFTTDTNSLDELRALKSQTVNLTNDDSALLSAESCAILECCLQKDPADRYASYDDLIKHLEFARQAVRQGTKTTRPATKPKKVVWQIIGAAAAAVAVASGLWALLGSKDPGGETHRLQVDLDPTASSDTTVSGLFAKARTAMLRGEFPEARQEFLSLADSAPQPTSAWANYNAGLCGLLVGDEEGSRADFSRLESVLNVEPDTARFFKQSGALLSGAQSIPAAKLNDFQADSSQSMVFLAAGLKNWQLGDAAEARLCLTRFQQANPTQAQWVNAYKSLVEPHLHDLNLLATMPPLSVEGLTAAQAAENLTKARQVLESIKLTGAVKSRAISDVDVLAKAVDELAAREQAMMAASMEKKRAEEFKLIAETAALAGPDVAQLKFARGLEALKALKVETPEATQRLTDETTLWQAAESFMTQLPREFPVGREIELERTNGATTKGLVVSANRDHVVLKSATPSTDVVVPYYSISAAQLLRIAEYPLDHDKVADSDEYFRRREAIVAFALKTGQIFSAAVRADRLAAELRSFREKWARLRPTLDLK